MSPAPDPVPLSSLSSEQKSLLQRLDDALSAFKGNVQVSIPGKHRVDLKENDKFGIKITTSVAGRLLVVEVAPGDKITQIFPVASARGHDVKAGEEIVLPTRDMGFDYFSVVEPRRDRRLIALVAPDTFDAKDQPDNLANLVARVSQAIDRDPPKTWGYGVLDSHY